MGLRKSVTDLEVEVDVLELELHGDVALHWRDRTLI
jgi:hypothetical protein